MTPAQEPYTIRCAEIWGGSSVKEDHIATPGVRAAIHSSASGAEQGGDLYYFSVCAYDTLTRIAIADVRGHGEQVSQLGAWLYQELAEHMNDPDGSRVLTGLNAVVRQRGFEAITTAAVATLHRDQGWLDYCYAGHPPLLLGRSGHSWSPLEAGDGIPLGILANAQYKQQRARVHPGDRLFLYTDGVAECPGAGETQYGDEAMLEALNRHRGRPLPDLRAALHEDLTAFAGGSLLHDDVTFLLVEVGKPQSLWKRRFLPGKPQVA